MYDIIVPEKFQLATVDQRREKIQELQYFVEELISEVDEVEDLGIEPDHYIIDGVYGREAFIPKDTLLVGKIHLKGQIVVLIEGDITIADENGIRRIQAPMTFISPAGIKRAGLAHEDTRWIAISATDYEEIEDIENELFVNNYSDLLEHK